jgi:hypothetical protein
MESYKSKNYPSIKSAFSQIPSKVGAERATKSRGIQCFSISIPFDSIFFEFALDLPSLLFIRRTDLSSA